MSANTLNNRSIGQTILDTFFNDIHSALDGDFVGRGATGIPTSGQNLGTLALPWGSLYCASINLNGSSLDTSKIVSPANRVVSGKTRTSSNQPAFLTPNGAAASVLIAGATTNLVLSIGGVAVTVNTDITKAGLTVAPSTSNTATVNDATANAQMVTRTWGEVGSPSKITVSSAGTNITNKIGKFAAFKLVHSASTEYFIALVESSTVISHAIRGYFYDSGLNPINAQPISNGDTITLMNLGYVFMTNDATTVDVTYNQPTYASSSPTSPATGDYWYDTVNQIWKRYDGTTFQIVNRTLIGLVVVDATNCVAARSMDFYAGTNAEAAIDLEIAATVTNIQAKRLFGSTSVNGKDIGFGYYLPIWNGTNNYASSSDYFSTFAASSTYYLYLTDQGATMISDIPPLYRPDLKGYYNRHNPWRCLGIATTDGSSNWSYVGTLKNNVTQFKARTRTALTSTGTTVGYLFTVTAASATIGATYTNNTQTFTVIATIAAGTQLLCTSTGAPTASGTLSKASGTGDASITFSAAQALATYTPPTDALYLNIRAVGGGGGGGGSGSSGTGTAGGNGTPTVFAANGAGILFICNGGAGGLATSAAATGGVGGTATISGSSISGVAYTGAYGQGGSYGGYGSGGNGGSSPLGGAGAGPGLSSNATAAVANTGSGGGGAGAQNGGTTQYSGSGGAAGGFVDALISLSSALPAFYYAIGAGGAGGTGAQNGSSGASGVIIVEECYQ